MNIEITNSSLLEETADAIVFCVWKDEELSGAAAEFEAASGGLLSRLIESGEVSTDCLSVTQLLEPAGVKSGVVAIVGLGLKADAKPWLNFRAAGVAAKKLGERKRGKVAFYMDDLATVQAVSGAMVGCVGQDIYRQEKKLNPIESFAWAGVDQAVLDHGQTMGSSINLTRKLVNLPANDIFPESFAEECQRVGGQAQFDVEVWDEERLQKEKCGALLAVAKGSDRPPRLVIMRYMGAGKSDPVLGLVGKGVTFDSGGLSLKPSPSMLDMKMDMAGAATVLGAMQAIARLKLPVNVIGFAGLAENMISGRSYRLGDVLTARSGKTVEVHNTDAEGRLVLADTLDVACEMGVSKLVDLATLTGACMVALGRNTVGLMTNDQEWADMISSHATNIGEQVWQLPMFPEFGEAIKSSVADIKNVGDGRWGGAMTAGKFLEEFVQDKPWVHLDIAGPSFAEKPAGWIDAGASGCMVQTLVELASNWK